MIHVPRGTGKGPLSARQMGFLSDAPWLNWNLCSSLVEKRMGGFEGRVPSVFRLLTVISLVSEM